LSGINSTTWPIEPHTKAKHDILRRYLSAWFPILSKWEGRLIYLDGFAGPGIYSGGEDGSPVIALDTAVSHFLSPKFKKIKFIFIEKDKHRAQKLSTVLEKRFPKLPNNISYVIRGNEFAPTFEQGLNELDEEGAQLAPTFAFLDPFGFSGLPMRLIGRLLNCKKCEVLITFMAGFVRRFHDEFREDALNELYATEGWKQIRAMTDPDERMIFLLKLYESQLRKVGGAEYIKSFGMVGTSGQIIYYLVFATKHLKGLEVMKEAMWNIDKTGQYRFSDVTGFNQSLLMDYEQEPRWVESAAKKVFEQYKGKTVDEEEIHRFVVADTQYLYRKAILQHLEKCRPQKILDVQPRQRAGSFPPGCRVTFSGGKPIQDFFS
jgi:three-Cys-motif partner protein